MANPSRLRTGVECRMGRLVGRRPVMRGSCIGFVVATLAIGGAINDVRAQFVTGACCLPNGTCTVTLGDILCLVQNGIYRGNGTTCVGVNCTGACCLLNGSCTSISSQNCATAAGEFRGFGSLCANQVCAGACCLPDKSCTETLQGNCTLLNGLFQGLGALCGDDCPVVMPTAFTYQGQLKRAGVPMNGLIAARFSLWLSPTGEDPTSQIGGTQPINSVEVVNGLFSVELDFGQDVFNGNARWLEVEIHDQDEPPESFVTLSPRQPLTPTPYSLQTRGIVVLETGDVGIGTKTPQARIHVKGPGEGLHIEGPVVGPENSAWVGFYDASQTRTGYVGDGSGSDKSIYLASDTGDVHLYTNAGAAVTAKNDGRVGIGTMSPANRLSVAGGGADFAGNVGIGTTTPAERLDLGGGNIAMGYEIVEASSTGNSASAICPSGKGVIGGGCVCGINKLINSAPSSVGVQWNCDCDEAGGGGTTARAICANIR